MTESRTIGVCIWDTNTAVIPVDIDIHTTAQHVCKLIAFTLSIHEEECDYYRLILVHTMVNELTQTNYHHLRTLKENELVFDMLNSVAFSHQKYQKYYFKDISWYFKDIRSQPINFEDEEISGSSSDDEEEDVDIANVSYIMQAERHGYLYKRSSKDPNLWKRRFCSITDKFWCLNPKRNILRGMSIQLSDDVIAQDNSASFNFPNVMVIHCPWKVKYFRANSEQDQRNWVQDFNFKVQLAHDNSFINMAEVICCDEERIANEQLQRGWAAVTDSDALVIALLAGEFRDSMARRIIDDNRCDSFVSNGMDSMTLIGGSEYYEPEFPEKILTEPKEFIDSATGIIDKELISEIPIVREYEATHNYAQYSCDASLHDIVQVVDHSHINELSIVSRSGELAGYEYYHGDFDDGDDYDQTVADASSAVDNSGPINASVSLANFEGNAPALLRLLSAQVAHKAECELADWKRFSGFTLGLLVHRQQALGLLSTVRDANPAMCSLFSFVLAVERFKNICRHVNKYSSRTLWLAASEIFTYYLAPNTGGGVTAGISTAHSIDPINECNNEADTANLVSVECNICVDDLVAQYDDGWSLVPSEAIESIRDELTSFIVPKRQKSRDSESEIPEAFRQPAAQPISSTPISPLFSAEGAAANFGKFWSWLDHSLSLSSPQSSPQLVANSASTVSTAAAQQDPIVIRVHGSTTEHSSSGPQPSNDHDLPPLTVPGCVDNSSSSNLNSPQSTLSDRNYHEAELCPRELRLFLGLMNSDFAAARESAAGLYEFIDTSSKTKLISLTLFDSIVAIIASAAVNDPLSLERFYDYLGIHKQKR